MFFEIKSLRASISVSWQIIEDVVIIKSALLFLKEKINYKNNYNTKKDFLNRIISEKNYRLNTNKKLNSLGILPNENQWEVIKNIKSDTLKFY